VGDIEAKVRTAKEGPAGGGEAPDDEEQKTRDQEEEEAPDAEGQEAWDQEEEERWEETTQKRGKQRPGGTGVTRRRRGV